MFSVSLVSTMDDDLDDAPCTPEKESIPDNDGDQMELMSQRKVCKM
jgi:hypothetical protein